MSSSDDDMPLSQRSQNHDSDDDTPMVPRKRPHSAIADSDDDDDNEPLQNKRVKSEPSSPVKLPTKKTPAKKAAPKKEPGAKATAKKAATPKKATPAKKAAAKPKAAKNGTVVKSEAAEVVKKENGSATGTPDPNGDEDKYRWWEAADLDGEMKWESLHHNGVIFPPPYEPLPKHVKLWYDGKPVDLPPEAEEVAGFFGAMLNSDHVQNPVFQKNFFEDFQQVLRECNGPKIEEFAKCDFTKMFAYFDQQREDKKSMTRDQKRAIKEEKDRMEEPYKFCMLNGRKEMVGNFRIEPPGLFRGRGAHPKTGKLKRRVMPEGVVLNMSTDCPVPPPPPGHEWGEVRHDNTVAWLAMWKENIADSFKYVRFAANSSVKGQSDFKKFETARNLRHHIEAIRRDYTKQLKSEVMQERQMATATYLIDKFALRAGGEKGDDEADTVGCCSLRYEHLTLKPPHTVIFDFLGKDSIRFYQEVEVDKQVFKNLRIFKKAPKQPGDDLFDRITPSLLNKQFQNYMKGLTAKVFRTYNASKTMQDQLNLIENEGTVAEKVVKFNAANRTVAILCNHQRTVSKTHGESVAKINDKLKELMWQKIRLKKMMLALEPGLKKKDPKFFAEIDDLIKEDEERIHETVIARARDQLHKKLKRDNEKLRLENKPELDESSLKEKFDKIDELEKEYAKELQTGKVEPKAKATVDKLRAQVETIENRINTTELSLKDKEDNSEVSLGTSKLNYIDPRLTVMFSKKFNVPIEKLFTKTLREKFEWAIESTDADWRF
ncbi:DNA topoisomerase 1 [Diutina catenulata]